MVTEKCVLAASTRTGSDGTTPKSTPKPTLEVPLSPREPRITVTEHGPYRVVGDVLIRDTDGTVLRRTGSWCLCRCGQSRNKPFCDGSHWYAGFRDPLPAELVKTVPSLYECAGGIEALERLTERFYDTILSEPDEVLEPIFRGMDPGHPRHVAAWLAEQGRRRYAERRAAGGTG